MWKVGQLKSEDKLRFVLVNQDEARKITLDQESWLSAALSDGQAPLPRPTAHPCVAKDTLVTTGTIYREGNIRIALAGDEFLILELGEMRLDLSIRLQVEMWEREMKARNIPGIDYFTAGIRSSTVRFDSAVIQAEEVARVMLDVARTLKDVRDIELPITIHKMPVVVDDPWTREATEYYMRTARKEAVYLPNNGSYVSKNNGRPGSGVRDAILKTPWLVIAKGFFLMLPLVFVSSTHMARAEFQPLDPRQRLLAQKYNPSRTKTPEGGLCLAGVIGS